jgi:hypothetical protein
MKKVTLSIAFCLSILTFSKAQDASLALAEKSLQLATESQEVKGLDAYCGVYKMKENPYIDEVKLTLKDGQLTSKTPEDEDITLQPLDTDVFYIADFKAKVIFTREKGIVKTVKVVAQGKEIVGEKL